jgi:SAM-dependent methyltransferase
MTIECPLCGGDDIAPSLARPDVPVFQNALHANREAAQAVPRGDLALGACRGCGFMFNAAFNPALVAYGADYENDQTLSPSFSDHVDLVADRVLGAATLDGPGVILEVGCGQGVFLERLIQRATRPLGAAIGFDPAWRGGTTREPLAIHARLFDEDAAAALGFAIDAVVTRHTIEHVADPVGFLRAIRAALPGDQPVALLVETPCVGWILDHGVLQDVFYEHCNYFTAASLGFAIEKAGFDLRAIEHVFGGQYLLAEAVARPRTRAMTVARPDGGPALAARAVQFAENVARQVAVWRDTLARARGNGGVALWGAGAKGVTFAGAVDPEGDIVDCLIDVNPRKQDHFCAVTGHRIVAPAQAALRGVRTVVVMNPNYRDEIAAEAARAGWPFDFLEA